MNELAMTDSLVEGKQPPPKIEPQLNNTSAKKRKAGLVETILLFTALPLIYFGWYYKDFELFSAETGWGYKLGIIGGVMMLVLMLYPLRKHARFMKNFGKVRYWFRLHMSLGILGPIAILYHANFGLGSVNSNVALVSMLVVACSGVIGRFVYSKIHNGLYGRKASFEELHLALLQAKQKVEQSQAIASDGFVLPLVQFEKRFVSLANKYVTGILLLPFLSLFSLMAYQKFKHQVALEISIIKQQGVFSSAEIKQTEYSLRRYGKKYLLNASKMIEFVVYERIFSLWHMLHLPLFMIMVLTGLFHVYAVHMY